jgi:hypothetical protein
MVAINGDNVDTYEDDVSPIFSPEDIKASGLNPDFEALEDIKDIAIEINGKPESVNLEKGKTYNISILGDNSKEILEILRKGDIVKVKPWSEKAIKREQERQLKGMELKRREE